MTRRRSPRRSQHRKLPYPQLRQKPQQTIHDQEPTPGRRKKLPTGKSKPTPPPVGPAFFYRPFFLSFLRPDDELAISKGAQTFLRPLCLLAVPTRGKPLVTTLSQRALATPPLTRPSGMASSGSAGRNRRATRGLRSP